MNFKEKKTFGRDAKLLSSGRNNSFDGGVGGKIQRTPEPTVLRCNYLFLRAWPLRGSPV
jgi:hypothetical protein